MKDYFNILGIAPGASEDEIKKAYRSLAMVHHPDRGGDQSKFQEVQEAYAVLSDPQKRAEWEMNRQGRNPFSQGRGGFDFNFGQPRGDPFESIFRHFQQGGDFGRQQQRVNRDLKVVVDLDLADTLAPQTKHISVKHLNSHRETVTVEIPRGVSSNMQMKYSGHGDRSYPDLPPGDLYISFRILRHPDFDIEGLDLIRTIKLNCIDAITGSTLSIKGLDGTEFSWNVPMGTQNGSRFRIGQQGLWSIDHPVRGSLILHINLVVPSNLTAEQLITLEQLSKELKENTGTL